MPCHGFGSLSCLVHLLAKRPNLPAGITWEEWQPNVLVKARFVNMGNQFNLPM